MPKGVMASNKERKPRWDTAGGYLMYCGGAQWKEISKRFNVTVWTIRKTADAERWKQRRDADVRKAAFKMVKNLELAQTEHRVEELQLAEKFKKMAIKLADKIAGAKYIRRADIQNLVDLSGQFSRLGRLAINLPLNTSADTLDVKQENVIPQRWLEIIGQAYKAPELPVKDVELIPEKSTAESIPASPEPASTDDGKESRPLG
jgi:hypothetical protein